MGLAAAGTRGELVAGGANGFELAFKGRRAVGRHGHRGVDGPAGRRNSGSRPRGPGGTTGWGSTSACLEREESLAFKQALAAQRRETQHLGGGAAGGVDQRLLGQATVSW